MSEEMWKLVNDIPNLLLNFQGKHSQTSLFSLSRGKAAFYLWQLALRGKKKRGELVQGGVLAAALHAIEMSPKDEEIQVRAPTIGLISSLCVDDAARVTVMGVRNAAVVNQLMGNLSFCTPCTIASAARALAVLAKEETADFVRAATSLNPLASCLSEDNSLAARVEDASCLATCLKAYIAKMPSFNPNLYHNLKKKELLYLLTRLCQESGLSAMHALAKEKAATCLFYLSQDDKNKKLLSENMLGIQALASVLVDPYCALIGKAHAAGTLYFLFTTWMHANVKGRETLSWRHQDLEKMEKSKEGGEGGGGLGNGGDNFNESTRSINLNASTRSLSLPPTTSRHLVPSSLRDEVSQFKEIIFSEEQKQARRHMVEALVSAELILPLLHLCCGPSGPPKAVDRAQSAPAPETKSKKGKKKKKKGKKGKKGKAPPGMNEANFYGAGCLRHISHYEEYKINIAELDGERYAIPLLNSKLPKVRWHARAILLNLSTTPSSEIRMMQFGAPKHMVGISKSTRAQLAADRPQTAPARSYR